MIWQLRHGNLLVMLVGILLSLFEVCLFCWKKCPRVEITTEVSFFKGFSFGVEFQLVH